MDIAASELVKTLKNLIEELFSRKAGEDADRQMREIWRQPQIPCPIF
ncbi:MAG: hypothetical protein IPK97_06990 [Ahniella sp.]|nr:hypothetical protein [Ahniella sp.]